MQTRIKIKQEKRLEQSALLKTGPGDSNGCIHKCQKKIRYKHMKEREVQGWRQRLLKGQTRNEDPAVGAYCAKIPHRDNHKVEARRRLHAPMVTCAERPKDTMKKCMERKGPATEKADKR